MRRLFVFTEDKFRSFDTKKQHKKCYELLAAFFEGIEPCMAQYHKVVTWLDKPIPQGSVYDLYHYHLAMAGSSISEDRFPRVEKQDKSEGLSFLPITVYLDRIRSAHNIGSILRTVEAFRLGSVLFSPQMVSPTHPQVVKTAMGAAEWVTVTKANSVKNIPHPIIALETVKDADPFNSVLYPDIFTLVVGNEEEGCSEDILKIASNVVQIPLYGRKNSLNVANAFAIIAQEITRQKRG